MAERTELEPATPCVTGRYSNRLNYRSALCSVGNEANITDCLDLRQRFFSSFESFAAKIAQVAIFSAFYRYLCPPEAASALLAPDQDGLHVLQARHLSQKQRVTYLPDVQCAELLLHLVAVVSLHRKSHRRLTTGHRQINFRKDLGIE